MAARPRRENLMRHARIVMLGLAMLAGLALAATSQAVGQAATKAVSKAATKTQTGRQHPVAKKAAQRQPAVHARSAQKKPCAARTWAGCQGWDPDPNVRMMIEMDAGRDDR